MRFRSPFAVALAALLAAPAVASSAPPRKTGTTRAAAPAAPAPAPMSKDLAVGGLVGVELGTLGGFMLRLDGEIPIQPLTPKVNLSGVGSIGFSRLSKDVWLGDVTWNVFSAIPAARFSVPAAPELTLYGDAGLGLYFGSFSMEQTFPAPLGTQKVSDSKVGFLMRFAAGGAYKLNPKTKLTAEIGLIPYFGDADTTNWTLGIGAMFAL
jgi:hypothetical protein